MFLAQHIHSEFSLICFQASNIFTVQTFFSNGLTNCVFMDYWEDTDLTKAAAGLRLDLLWRTYDLDKITWKVLIVTCFWISACSSGSSDLSCSVCFDETFI